MLRGAGLPPKQSRAIGRESWCSCPCRSAIASASWSGVAATRRVRVVLADVVGLDLLLRVAFHRRWWGGAGRGWPVGVRAGSGVLGRGAVGLGRRVAMGGGLVARNAGDRLARRAGGHGEHRGG